MFYDKLLALCGQRNKKITPVVKELGLSTGGIANWRNGAEPDTKTLRLFCDYFNVPATYFLDDEKKPPVETEGEEDKEKTPEPLDPDHNVLIMRGRDGSYIRKQLTDEEVRALTVLVSQMKDAPDDI